MTSLATLGWVVVHSLWLGTLVAGITAMALSLLPDRLSRTRHLVACAGLVVMLMAPVALVWGGADPLGDRARAPIMQAVDETVGLQAVIAWRALAIPGAAVGWVLGVLVCALRLGREWRRAHELTRTDLAEAGEDVDRLVADLRTQLSLATMVSVRRSLRVSVPMVLGWQRPVVLLPIGTAEELPRPQLRAILAHELAHVRRRDYLANLLQITVETLLFHHPAARWLSRRIRTEREYCCDDVAVRAGSDPADYARALAALDEARDDCRLAVAAASGTLLDRIQRIVGCPRPMLTPARGALLLVAASALAGALLALTATVPPSLPLDVQVRTRVAGPTTPIAPPSGAQTMPRTPQR